MTLSTELKLMALTITSNIPAMTATRNLGENNRKIQHSTETIASGDRINHAADDAAGLSISTHINAQLRSLHQAGRNANDSVSLIQVAEGGLNEIGNIIIRLRELSIQSSSDTIGDLERSFINREVTQLKSEIDRITATTKWGTTQLLDGSTPDFSFQVGIYNNVEEDRIVFNAKENIASLDALGLSDIDVNSKLTSQAGLVKLDMAQNQISSMRSNLGSLQSRMNSTFANIGYHQENFSAAKSRIRDTDIANASADLARDQVMMESSIATLTQANQNTAYALKLMS